MMGPKTGSGRSAIAANSQRIRCRIGANVALVGATPTAVPWDIETYKFGITHDVAVNNDQIVIVIAGIYLVSFTATLELTGTPNTVDPMEASITVGGADAAGSATYRPEATGVWPEDANTVVTLVVTSILSLSAGAIVRGQVQAPPQAAGSPLLLKDGTNGPSEGATHIDIHRLS